MRKCNFALRIQPPLIEAAQVSGRSPRGLRVAPGVLPKVLKLALQPFGALKAEKGR
jgi:hypothetical protein